MGKKARMEHRGVSDIIEIAELEEQVSLIKNDLLALISLVMVNTPKRGSLFDFTTRLDKRYK